MPRCLFLAHRSYHQRIRRRQLDIGSDPGLSGGLTDRLTQCSTNVPPGASVGGRSTRQGRPTKFFSSQKLTIILESYLASSLQSSLPEKQKPSFPIHDTRGLVFTNSTRAWITLTFLSASFLLYCNRKLQQICHPVIKLCCSLFRYNP